MSNTVGRAILALVWAVVTYGILQVHHLDIGCSICGAWGCGPTVEALISYHGFWLMLIVPAALMLDRWLPIAFSRLLAPFLLVAGLMVMLAYVGWDLKIFLSRDRFTEYWLQRAGFTFITWTDYPVWQIALGGLAMMVQQRLRKSSLDRPSADIDPDPSAEQTDAVAAAV